MVANLHFYYKARSADVLNGGIIAIRTCYPEGHHSMTLIFDPDFFAGLWPAAVPREADSQVHSLSE